jgi:hypothetical protein
LKGINSVVPDVNLVAGEEVDLKIGCQGLEFLTVGLRVQVFLHQGQGLGGYQDEGGEGRGQPAMRPMPEPGKNCSQAHGGQEI